MLKNVAVRQGTAGGAESWDPQSAPARQTGASLCPQQVLVNNHNSVGKQSFSVYIGNLFF